MGETEEQHIAAFERLAAQRLDASYRLANAILGDESQSRDAVHDAFVVAWQRWASLRDPDKLDAWFDRIVVNTCRDRLRRAKRRRATDIANVPLSIPDMSADIHRRIVIEQAVAQLKPEDIVVLALRHFLDLELEDVAVLLDIPLATAKTRLRSAKMRLRDLLDDQSFQGVPR